MNLTVVLILLIVGFCLLMAEIILPGGIAGVSGGFLLLTGIAGAFSIDPRFGLWVLVGATVAGLGTVMFLIHCLQHTRLGKHIVHQESARDWYGYEDTNAHLEGKTGTAHGPLRPAGTCTIQGQRFHVVTQGEMIENGSIVRVISVKGNRIVVAEANNETAEKENEAD